MRSNATKNITVASNNIKNSDKYPKYQKIMRDPRIELGTLPISYTMGKENFTTKLITRILGWQDG